MGRLADAFEIPRVSVVTTASHHQPPPSHRPQPSLAMEVVATKRPHRGHEEPVIPAKRASKDVPDFHRMQVYVRIRPVSKRESTDSRHRTVVAPINEVSLVYDPPFEDTSYYYRGKNYKEPGKKEAKNIKFDFDRVFDSEATNIQVYQETAEKFIDPFLKGYNVSVFAYGATGSGKTHTMLGQTESVKTHTLLGASNSSNPSTMLEPKNDEFIDPGIMFFTMMELYDRIKSMSVKGEGQFEVSISYFEIYNEQVFDLLTPTHSRPLAVREDANRGVVVSNLSIHTPKDADHLLQLLRNGNQVRTQHPTDANNQSSRSHAIFQVYLMKQISSPQEMSIPLSKMSLIDLAGSERASVAYRENRKKSVQREGSNINKSLLALGNCINALASKKKESKRNFHVPYRDSKLTLLLRDSLGGNCYTAMIATVSPSFLSKDDTHNTLVYAQRAKGIALNLTKNTMPIEIQPKNYSRALESLEQKNSDLEVENAFLKSELNRLKSQLSKQPENPVAVNDDSYRILQQSQNQLDLLFTEQLNLRRQLMEAESNLRKLDVSFYYCSLPSCLPRCLPTCFTRFFSFFHPFSSFFLLIECEGRLLLLSS